MEGIPSLVLPIHKLPGIGAQGRLRISVDVAGSGWSKGELMSARVTRKLSHPRRLREFGRDLLCSGDAGEEGWYGAMKQGGE